MQEFREGHQRLVILETSPKTYHAQVVGDPVVAIVGVPSLQRLAIECKRSARVTNDLRKMIVGDPIVEILDDDFMQYDRNTNDGVQANN